MPVAAQLQRRPSNSHHNYRGNPSLTLDSANDERANETGRNDAVVTAHHGTNPAVLIGITLPASRENSLLLVSCTRRISPLKQTPIALADIAPRRRRHALSIPGTPAYRKREA